jgi:hypothetical protein
LILTNLFSLENVTRRTTLAAILALTVLGGCAPRSGPGTGPEPVYLHMGPLELSATLEQDGVDVMGSVDIMNTSRQPVLVEYDGGCELAVLVTGGASPLWDQTIWWREHPGVCPTTTSTRLEIPGRTLARILTPAVTTLQIAGDSIPLGSFPAAVRLRLMSPRDTLLVLPTGPVRLDG